MAETLPTVAVMHPEKPGGRMIINEADFDPAEHVTLAEYERLQAEAAERERAQQEAAAQATEAAAAQTPEAPAGQTPAAPPAETPANSGRNQRRNQRS